MTAPYTPSAAGPWIDTLTVAAPNDPVASALTTLPIKQSADNLALLKASAVASELQEFTTAGSHTWTKPANAKANGWTDITLVGGGEGGGNGSTNGGDGGASGSVRHARVKTSSLPSSFSVVVGAGGDNSPSDVDAGHTYVTISGVIAFFAHCGGASANPLPFPGSANLTDAAFNGAEGGTGGVGAAPGGNGKASGYGSNGVGGAAANPGTKGRGYGAGGGGSAGSSGGGGGGGGGYGWQSLAGDGAAYGGVGAVGYALIHTEVEAV